MYVKLLVNLCYTVFFADHLKQPVERPQQILANYGLINWKTFELLQLFFEAFRISWVIWQR